MYINYIMSYFERNTFRRASAPGSGEIYSVFQDRFKFAVQAELESVLTILAHELISATERRRRI